MQKQSSVWASTHALPRRLFSLLRQPWLLKVCLLCRKYTLERSNFKARKRAKWITWGTYIYNWPVLIYTWSLVHDSIFQGRNLSNKLKATSKPLTRHLFYFKIKISVNFQESLQHFFQALPKVTCFKKTQWKQFSLKCIMKYILQIRQFFWDCAVRSKRLWSDPVSLEVVSDQTQVRSNPPMIRLFRPNWPLIRPSPDHCPDFSDQNELWSDHL